MTATHRNGTMNTWLLGIIGAGFLSWSGAVWYAASTAYRSVESLRAEVALVRQRLDHAERDIEELQQR